MKKMLLAPNYERNGWGMKMGLNKEKYAIAAIIFHAEDHMGKQLLDSFNIYPESNLALGVNGSIRPIKGLELSADYTNSGIQRDARDPKGKSTYDGGLNLMSYLTYEAVRTVFTKAVKLQMNYIVHQSTLGIGYERIDPGYRTMGAYFFNNDLENITINLAQAFFIAAIPSFQNTGCNLQVCSKRDGRPPGR